MVVEIEKEQRDMIMARIIEEWRRRRMEFGR